MNVESFGCFDDVDEDFVNRDNGMNGDDSGLDSSLPSSAGSFSSNATSTTVDLEKKFQQSLSLPPDILQSEMLEDSEIDQVTQQELDALYARDMFDLTGEERDEALHDIHGVTKAIVETPEFVEHHRTLLQNELALLVSRPRQRTRAYQLALQQDSEYICSRKFQLLFLRADRWKPREAAARLVGFLETKLSLFGPELLTKRITLSTLSQDDQRCLESGFFQLLPVRDAAGRAILSGIPMLRQYQSIENLKRSFFYMIMTALEDDETQKAGVVMVGYNIGPRRVMDRKAAFAIQSIRGHLPFYLASVHYCYDDFRSRPMMTVAMLVMGATNRVRFRTHYGQTKEALDKLATFGIPWQSLPVAHDGVPKTKAHRSWLKLRKTQEQQQLQQQQHQTSGTSSSLEIVVVPSRVDILLGRGKPIQDHPGNLRYQSLLDFYQETYERAKKYQKMKISHQILARVAQYGGRFLRQEGAGWMEVDPTVARDKVAHAFRTRRVAVAKSGRASSGTIAVAVDSRLQDGTKRKNSDILALDANSMRLPWSTLPISTETELGDDILDSFSGPP